MGGAVIRKTGILRSEHDDGIMRILFSVMLPCFILDRTLGQEVLHDYKAVGTSAGLGFALVAIGVSIGFAVGKLIGLKTGTGIRTFAISSGCQNFGFTAIPVVEVLWSSSAVAILFIHNIGPELALWSIGPMLMSGERGISWKQLINGPIIAVVIGLLLAALGIDDLITGPPRAAISMIGIGAFPLAIVMTGAFIVDLVGSEKPSWKIISASIIVRIVLAPIAIILCAKFIPMAIELKQVLLVQASMPAALTPILLARIYGGRPGVAVQIVVATTVVSIFTLPYVITYGIHFLNLLPNTP